MHELIMPSPVHACMPDVYIRKHGLIAIIQQFCASHGHHAEELVSLRQLNPTSHKCV